MFGRRSGERCPCRRMGLFRRYMGEFKETLAPNGQSEVHLLSSGFEADDAVQIRGDGEAPTLITPEKPKDAHTKGHAEYASRPKITRNE